MLLHDLPDDILIPILSLCDIDTLFAARLTSRPLRSVIDSYIRTIAPHVARNTFPNIPYLHRVPQKTASLKWLRGLVPAYLSTVALDKDKLRRFPYVNSGFPYGIPCESEVPLAVHWRRRVTNGWRVLRCFYLISRDIYSKPIQELEGRPTVMRRVSTGVKATRIWQTVSCPYQACNEHGVRHIFDIRRGSRDHSHSPVCEDGRRGSEGDFIEEVKKRETLVLKRRLEWLATLRQDELLDYMYVWRLLLWMFRPYRKPDTTSEDLMKGWKGDVPTRVNWQAELTNVSQGCSWLNWFVLHVGSTPFWQQWYGVRSGSKSKPNAVRDIVWKSWMQRSYHQVELEREFGSKFEFAVRKRSLDPQRLKRLNDEFRDDGLGAATTISLDCIPWEYDQNPIINKPTCDFPWYSGGWVYMDADVWMRVGGRRGRIDYITSRGRPDSQESDEEEDIVDCRGPLENVPYLVYLSVEEEKSLQAETRDLTRYGIVF